MKRTIRFGSFETNSSSSHSLTLCSLAEFTDWKDGEIVYDRWEEKFVPPSEMEKETDPDEREWRFLSYDDVFDWNGKLDMESFQGEYTTPNGETVVAFGWYGYN